MPDRPYKDSVEVPAYVLRQLLTELASSTVLKAGLVEQGLRAAGKPAGNPELGFSDSVARSMAWLWRSGQKERLWEFIAEMLRNYRSDERAFAQFGFEPNLSYFLDELHDTLLAVLDEGEISDLNFAAMTGVPPFYDSSNLRAVL